MPNFEEAFGPELLAIRQLMDAEVAAANAGSEEVTYVNGSLDLMDLAQTRQKVLLNPSELISWQSSLYVPDAGNYTVDLVLFRDGQDDLGVSASDTASISGGR